MLPNPCVLGGPQHKGQNQKWLPHRFFSRAHKRAQMIAGHRDAEDAHQAGWPRVSPRPTPPAGTAPPPPPVGCCQVVSATIPTFSWLPENYGILHDASWYPKTLSVYIRHLNH